MSLCGVWAEFLQASGYSYLLDGLLWVVVVASKAGRKKKFSIAFWLPPPPVDLESKKENAGCLIGENHGHRGDSEVVHYIPNVQDAAREPPAAGHHLPPMR